MRQISQSSSKMLTTKRPTPTTVLYTFSTRSAPKTLTSHLLAALHTTLRLVAALALILALLSEYAHLNSSSVLALQPKLPNPSNIPPLLRLAGYAATFYFALRKGYASESLLVVRGLGVQTATAGGSWLWGGSTRFIAASAVRDVFIHEAFKGFEVRFYLCIVVEGEEGVVVVFPVRSSLYFYLQMQLQMTDCVGFTEHVAST